MTVLLVAIAILVFSGLAAIFFANRPRIATVLGAGGALVGCVLGLEPSFRGLFRASTESLQLPWHVPGGAFHVQLDALSAFFLVPIFVLAALAAVYGGEYLLAYRDTKTLAPQWFFFNLFVASMALIVVARNVVLFLVSWEVMSVTAFFLVTFEHEKHDVRVAGWIYLVATHLGAAFLLAMFLLLGRQAHSLDFDDFVVAGGSLAPASAGLVFVLALIGFGAKAGLVPLHVWLPEAHPAAPSHVSALMSGVMIKIGVYGILRTMMFLGTPAAWWGPVLVIIGLTGGVLGVSFAVFQRDLKRALAYSSIENVGLIVLALGVGVWGITSGHPTVAILGLAGGLLHIWNHSLMKGLMFLSAGSVLHGTGTKDLERLGGLMKRMPRTGVAMTLGGLAIAAVPPLNGFVSEWLIYMAMLRGGLDFTGVSRIVLLLAVGVLALIGGLASICFVRLVGIVLLGEGRSEEARHAHESSVWMTVPLGVLAVFCVVAGVLPRALVSIFSQTVEQVFGISTGTFMAALDSPQSPLAMLGTLNVVVWSALIIGALILLVLRKKGPEVTDATWGCGYVAPTPRIQYTGQSFAELMVTRLFLKSLRPKTSMVVPQGLFPSDGKLATEYPDPLISGLYQPFFERWAARFAQLRWVQQGKIHYYLMYFVVVLVLALAWVVFRGWVMP